MRGSVENNDFGMELIAATICQPIFFHTMYACLERLVLAIPNIKNHI